MLFPSQSCHNYDSTPGTPFLCVVSPSFLHLSITFYFSLKWKPKKTQGTSASEDINKTQYVKILSHENNENGIKIVRINTRASQEMFEEIIYVALRTFGQGI